MWALCDFGIYDSTAMGPEFWGGAFFALGLFGLAAPIKCLEKVALVLWCILLDQCVPCGVGSDPFVVGRVALIWRWTLSRDLVNRASVADRQVGPTVGAGRVLGWAAGESVKEADGRPVEARWVG